MAFIDKKPSQFSASLPIGPSDVFPRSYWDGLQYVDMKTGISDITVGIGKIDLVTGYTLSGGTSNVVSLTVSDNSAINQDLTTTSSSVQFAGLTIFGNIVVNGTATAIDMTTYTDWSGDGYTAPFKHFGSTNPNKEMLFGFDTTNNVGIIQAVEQLVATREVKLNPTTGRVSVHLPAAVGAESVFHVNGDVMLNELAQASITTPSEGFKLFANFNDNGYPYIKDKAGNLYSLLSGVGDGLWENVPATSYYRLKSSLFGTGIRIYNIAQDQSVRVSYESNGIYYDATDPSALHRFWQTLQAEINIQLNNNANLIGSKGLNFTKDANDYLIGFDNYDLGKNSIRTNIAGIDSDTSFEWSSGPTIGRNIVMSLDGLGTLNVVGSATAKTFNASGLSGATEASRYAGATTSGAPISGTFAVGDYVIDQAGAIWVCTVAGTPGTWNNVGTGSDLWEVVGTNYLKPRTGANYWGIRLYNSGESQNVRISYESNGIYYDSTDPSALHRFWQTLQAERNIQLNNNANLISSKGLNFTKDATDYVIGFDNYDLGKNSIRCNIAVADADTTFEWSSGSTFIRNIVMSLDGLGALSVVGPATAQAFSPTGLSGATATSRYVGATASGAPISGTFAIGDYVVDQSGAIWICTVAGTPGTWTDIAGGGGYWEVVDTTYLKPIASYVGIKIFGDGSLSAPQLTLAGESDATQLVSMGFDTTNNKAFIQAQSDTGPVNYRNLMLQPSGSNVAIGHPLSYLPVNRLEVSGNISNNAFIISEFDATATGQLKLGNASQTGYLIAGLVNATGKGLIRAVDGFGIGSINLDVISDNLLLTSDTSITFDTSTLYTTSSGTSVINLWANPLKLHSQNAGSGNTDWIAASIGGQAGVGSRVVIGLQFSKATVGAHSDSFDAWHPLYLQYQGYNLGIALETTTQTANANLHSGGSTIIGTAASAIADASIYAGQTNIWVDEGGDLLTFKVKYGAGTIRTGTIPLV